MVPLDLASIGPCPFGTGQRVRRKYQLTKAARSGIRCERGLLHRRGAGLSEDLRGAAEARPRCDQLRLPAAPALPPPVDGSPLRDAAAHAPAPNGRRSESRLSGATWVKQTPIRPRTARRGSPGLAQATRPAKGRSRPSSSRIEPFTGVPGASTRNSSVQKPPSPTSIVNDGTPWMVMRCRRRRRAVLRVRVMVSGDGTRQGATGCAGGLPWRARPTARGASSRSSWRTTTPGPG